MPCKSMKNCFYSDNHDIYSIAMCLCKSLIINILYERLAKDRLLPSDLPSFKLQKVAYCSVKCRILQSVRFALVLQMLATPVQN